MHPLALQLLHVAAHIDGIPRVVEDLRSGRNVVLDRCWWSTLVYGLTDGVSTERLEKAVELETPHWMGIKPTCLFLIQRRSARPCLIGRYGVLAQTEAAFYPIHEVRNDGEINEVVQHLLTVSGLTTTSIDSQISLFPINAQDAYSTLGTQATAPRRSSGKAVTQTPLGTEVYDTYWRFAAERQAIYIRRLQGDIPPWTEDPILVAHRFTNTYRAADRVSQYLIKNVIYSEGDHSPEDTIFRILLFKIFNKVDTWEALQRSLGNISFRDFNFERYASVLEKVALKSPIYSAAYIMPPPKGYEHARKYANHLSLLGTMMESGLARKLASAKRMADVFNELLSFAGLGPFLAYQFAIDLNYSELIDFSESEFVVAGPGARSGIKRCFGSKAPLTDGEFIQRTTELQESEFSKRGLIFHSLWGRPLQLIDCQNLFCEVDKYARVAHPEPVGTKKKRIKQRFASSLSIEQPWFPPKWGINQAIPLAQGSQCS
jgi:hypothetical protein